MHKRGAMARCQCLGKDLMGWEQEGILDKHGSFTSHNLIHLEQALSAPSQRNSPEVSAQATSSAQTGRVHRAPPNLLESSNKTLRFHLEGKLHSPRKFSSSCCYLTHFPGKNGLFQDDHFNTHTHLYEYTHIHTQRWGSTGPTCLNNLIHIRQGRNTSKTTQCMNRIKNSSTGFLQLLKKWFF